MKKRNTTLIIIIAVVVIIIVWFIGKRNSFVKAEEQVTAQWSQVETAYQRRMDLTNQLVATVKGDAEYEQSTLEAVIEARSKVGSVQIDANNLTETNVAAYQKAQDQLSNALSKSITLTVERYPELKATQAFRDLMTSIEGSENRISVERHNYNEVVLAYNKSIRLFPANIVANLCGFESKGYFTSNEEASTAPSIDFDFDK